VLGAVCPDIVSKSIGKKIEKNQSTIAAIFEVGFQRYQEAIAGTVFVYIPQQAPTKPH
jgi:hypothetical protein